MSNILLRLYTELIRIAPQIMAIKKIYNEENPRFTMTLTGTALEWLEQKRMELGANGISDVIGRMARLKLNKK